MKNMGTLLILFMLFFTGCTTVDIVGGLKNIGNQLGRDLNVDKLKIQINDFEGMIYVPKTKKIFYFNTVNNKNFYCQNFPCSIRLKLSYWINKETLVVQYLDLNFYKNSSGIYLYYILNGNDKTLHKKFLTVLNTYDSYVILKGNNYNLIFDLKIN